MILIYLFMCFVINNVHCVANGKLENVFTWKQIGYDIDGVRYTRDSDFERNPNVIHFEDDIEEKDKFYIQYNNVPVGLEVYGDRVFVSVPRRRFGVPSTLNYVKLGSPSPLLRPFPPKGTKQGQLYSVYRGRVDSCDRLWVLDTGLLEAPGARRQVNQPSLVIFDLKTTQVKHRYYLRLADLLTNRTSGGLTSVTVDTSQSCDDAYAYITDLATQGMVVFSLKDMRSWRIDHPTMMHDEKELNFTVAGFTVPWKDGMFSVALNPETGTAYYHPLVSGQEFSVSTEELKSGKPTLTDPKSLGYRGPNTQSGSHAYHAETNTILFANVAQDAILCWNVDTPMTEEYVVKVAQDHEKLVYISDLKIVNDDVWVLANKMPVYVFSTLDKNQPNFFIHKGKIRDLIKDTPCDQDVDERNGERKQVAKDKM